MIIRTNLLTLITLTALIGASDGVLSKQTDEMLEDRGRNFQHPANPENATRTPAVAPQTSAIRNIDGGNLGNIARLLPAREALWFFRAANEAQGSNPNLKPFEQEWQNIRARILPDDLRAVRGIPYLELENFKAFFIKNAHNLDLSETTMKRLQAHFTEEALDTYLTRVVGAAYVLAQRFDCLDHMYISNLMVSLTPLVNDLDSICATVKCFQPFITPVQEEVPVSIGNLILNIRNLGENWKANCTDIIDLLTKSQGRFDFRSVGELFFVIRNLGEDRDDVLKAVLSSGLITNKIITCERMLFADLMPFYTADSTGPIISIINNVNDLKENRRQICSLAKLFIHDNMRDYMIFELLKDIGALGPERGAICDSVKEFIQDDQDHYILKELLQVVKEYGVPVFRDAMRNKKIRNGMHINDVEDQLKIMKGQE